MNAQLRNIRLIMFNFDYTILTFLLCCWYSCSLRNFYQLKATNVLFCKVPSSRFYVGSMNHLKFIPVSRDDKRVELFWEWIKTGAIASNIKLESWPAVFSHMSRRQTPYLQGSSQETGLLCVKFAATETAISSDIPGVKQSFVTISPSRQGWVTDRPPHFCSCFQFRYNQRICTQTRHLGCSASAWPPPVSPAQQPALERFPFFVRQLPHSPVSLWVYAKCKWWWMIPLLKQALNKEIFLCLSCMIFIATTEMSTYFCISFCINPGRERSSIYCSAPQMAITSRTWSAWSQELLLCLLPGWLGPKHLCCYLLPSWAHKQEAGSEAG